MNMKKQARRERAAKRFSILSLADWDTMRFQAHLDHVMGKREKCPKTPAPLDQISEHYARYVERKNVEAAALGIPRSLPA